MSPKPIAKPLVPAGDYGLGLCLQCLGEIIARGDEAPSPRFAVTLAPMPFPPGQAVMYVPAPACWEHVQGANGGGPARRPLLVANGKLG